MYLNTAMLSLLLGTAFMTVQPTTVNNDIQIQVNQYSDSNCKDFVQTIYATEECSSVSIALNSSFLLVCPKKSECPGPRETTQVIFYGANCTSDQVIPVHPLECCTPKGQTSNGICMQGNVFAPDGTQWFQAGIQPPSSRVYTFISA